LIFSQGVGEIPFLEQATFTIWEDKKSMEEFAFGTFHGNAIEKVRSVNGFKEQMFTRFQPVAAFGTWGGKNILEKYAIPTFTTEKTIVPVLI
jgi:spheroidene monooxygenase